MIANRFEHAGERVAKATSVVTGGHRHGAATEPIIAAPVGLLPFNLPPEAATPSDVWTTVESLLHVLLTTARIARDLEALPDRDWRDVATGLLAGVAQLARLRTIASGLNRRQQETLRHLLRGQSEKEIAQEMGLSIHTVHIYAKAIYTEFSVSTRPELLGAGLLPGFDLSRS